MTRRAFTLIELLIVVAIIAILAAIAVPNFLEAQTRSKVARAKADLRTLALGLESYAVDNTNYPYSESINSSIWLAPGGFPKANPAMRCGGVTSPIAYLTSVPVDVFSHPNVDIATGLPTGEPAPIYYEKAGFGFNDGVKLTDMPSPVPNDLVGTTSIAGVQAASTLVRSDLQTPRRFVLYSLGPDITPHAIDMQSKAEVSRSRYFIGNRYDPTNGTVSTGNVIRFADGTNFP